MALSLLIQDSLPKIAEISAFSGTVEVTSARGVKRAPTRFGTRLRNAELRDEDTVTTGAGATAVLLFPDASKFSLKENSSIQILQKQLPQPAPDGQTVGRRVKVIVGELISEIIPNRDIRTDFETVAGSAAARGTALRWIADATSATLEGLDGNVRYYHTAYNLILNFLPNQRVKFTHGSLIIEVEEDGGRPITGQLGPRVISLTKGDRIVIETTAGNVHTVIVDGPVEIDGQPAGAAVDVRMGGEAASQDVAVRPGMPTGGIGEAPPGSSPFPAASPDNVLNGVTEMLGTTTLQSSIYPLLIDDFARPDSGLIGNGWLETGAWDIISQRAEITLAPLAFGFIERDLGNQSTFAIQSTFAYSDPQMEVTLEVNGLAGVPDTGPSVHYLGFFGGSIQIFDGGTPLGTQSGIGAVPNFTDFTLSLSCDGATLTGMVTGPGVSGLISGPMPGG